MNSTQSNQKLSNSVHKLSKVKINSQIDQNNIQQVQTNKKSSLRKKVSFVFDIEDHDSE